MRIVDYFRLGLAGLKAHKKRTLTVVIIVGLLFSVITTGTFILQGLEDIVLGTMLKPTGGKVLIISSVDMKTCEQECNLEKEVAQIESNVKKYGGKLVEAEVAQTADGIFYQLRENIFGESAENITSNATQVVVPLDTAAELAGIEMPNHDTDVQKKLEVIKKVRNKTLHQIMTSETGAKYYIAEILPSGMYANDLSFINIGQGNNPLNLIFGQIRTSISQNFITRPAEVNPGVDSGHKEQRSGFVTMENVDAEAMGIVFAEFNNIEAAYDYYKDKVNYCSESDRIFGMCSKEHQYQVMAAISDPLTTYENLQNVWLVFKIVAAVLAVIAIIITLSTYARLIDKDSKIILLYHTMGATKLQIQLIFLTYFFLINILVIIFSLLTALTAAILLSLLNQTALLEIFTLGFGTAPKQIWFIGWHPTIYYLLATIFLTAILAILLSNRTFTTKQHPAPKVH